MNTNSLTPKNRFFLHKNSNQTLSAVIKAFFSSWAITRIGSFHSMDFMGLVFFLLLFYFYRNNRKNKADYSLSQSTLTFVFSGLFSLMYLAGSYRFIISDVTNKLFQLSLIFVTFIGLFILFREILLFLNSYLLKDIPKNHSQVLSKRDTDSNYLPKRILLSREKLPFLCFFLCILCRIPYFLYSYPGIMTPDSMNQLEQVLGLQSFSNHHPWIHTMTISLFYHLGSLFTDNRNLAFAFYTVFQIVFMAAAASYLIFVLSKYIKSTKLLLCILLFYALMPYHNVMAICIWKDVLFSGSVLFFCTSYFDLLKHQMQRKTDYNTNNKTKTCSGNTLSISSIRSCLLPLFIYTGSGILVCLYRSNGWYAFILSLPFFLLSFWKSKKVMLPIHALILLVVLTVKGPVMEHYQVVQPDFVESLSIPLQQMGRVIATGQPLTEEELSLLEKIMEPEHVPALYKEYISDPMKELVRANNPGYLADHKSEYLKLWFQLGCKYPGIYLEAYIEQTKGFYSPSTVYSVIEVDGIIENDCGITREYLLRGKFIVKIREILIKLQEMIPLYGSLWSMGSLFWIILISLYLTLIRSLSSVSKTLDPISVISLWFPCISIILTLLIATPVAIEFRYAYHLAYTLPLYLGVFYSEWSSTTYE